MRPKTFTGQAFKCNHVLGTNLFFPAPIQTDSQNSDMDFLDGSPMIVEDQNQTRMQIISFSQLKRACRKK